MIAARRLHLPLMSAQRPSPRSASDVSLVVLTVKVAASAPAAPSSSAQANGSIVRLRACLETTRGAAARDFGCGQGGEFRASPQRAVRNESTPATDKRPAARRVFGEKAVWLRCSSVEDPPGIFSFVAPRHPAFSPKTAPLVVSKQALRAVAGRQASTWASRRTNR